MKMQNLATNVHSTGPSPLRSNVPEETRKYVPTLDAIHRRALEIHAERGDHSCDLDEFLDEWLYAERELREKYNMSKGDGAKGK